MFKGVMVIRCIVLSGVKPYYKPSPPRGRWWSIICPPSHVFVTAIRILVPDQYIAYFQN